MEEKQMPVYNLDFPPNVKTLKIGDYTFKRIEGYETALLGLQQLGNIFDEFDIKENTGTHQITANVTIPAKEKAANLSWDFDKCTELDDVLLLLSLFRGREIFAKNWEGNPPIVADPRVHPYGGQLICSIEYDSAWVEKATGQICKEDELGGRPVWDFDRINQGFESTLNEILRLISSEEWKKLYDNGFVLMLYRQAVKRHSLAVSFLGCWTIWEHLFACLNRDWMSDSDLITTKAANKIGFILNKFFSIHIDAKARAEIERICSTRNRLIHYGKPSDKVTRAEMEVFIRITEQIVAIILELVPSNIFNSIEDLQATLKGKKKETAQ